MQIEMYYGKQNRIWDTEFIELNTDGIAELNVESVATEVFTKQCEAKGRDIAFCGVYSIDWDGGDDEDES